MHDTCWWHRPTSTSNISQVECTDHIKFDYLPCSFLLSTTLRLLYLVKQQNYYLDLLNPPIILGEITCNCCLLLCAYLWWYFLFYSMMKFVVSSNENERNIPCFRIREFCLNISCVLKLRIVPRWNQILLNRTFSCKKNLMLCASLKWTDNCELKICII